MPNIGKNRKNDQYQRMNRRRRVADLYLRGFGQVEIAREVHCSQGTVCNDLEAVRQEWLGSALRDFSARKAEELAKLDGLEAQAWAGWERSCRDARTRHKRAEAMRASAAKGKGKAKEQARLVVVRRIIQTTTKQQAGDPRFLERVAWCIECRLKVMGALKDAKQVQVTGIDWDALAGAVPDGPVDDPIERTLAEVAAPPPVNRLGYTTSRNGNGHE